MRKFLTFRLNLFALFFMDYRNHEAFGLLNGLVESGGPDEGDYSSVLKCVSDLVTEFGTHTIDICKELHPVFYSTKTTMGYATVKPRGYAGDFELIERLYNQWTASESDLYRWDVFLHNQPAAKATRNRVHVFCNLVQTLLEDSSKPINVLNVGSGPGREVSTLFNTIPHADVIIDCVDNDADALKYARTLNAKWDNHVSYINKNIFRFRTEYKYDLIWSAGLFDYLNDRQFIYLMKRLMPMLKPAGLLVIGNFSNDNPTKSLMDFGHWFLQHRTKAELKDIATKLVNQNDVLEVISEPEQVNLFLKVKKTNQFA